MRSMCILVLWHVRATLFHKESFQIWRVHCLHQMQSMTPTSVYPSWKSPLWAFDTNSCLPIEMHALAGFILALLHDSLGEYRNESWVETCLPSQFNTQNFLHCNWFWFCEKDALQNKPAIQYNFNFKSKTYCFSRYVTKTGSRCVR